MKRGGGAAVAAPAPPPAASRESVADQSLAVLGARPAAARSRGRRGKPTSAKARVSGALPEEDEAVDLE